MLDAAGACGGGALPDRPPAATAAPNATPPAAAAAKPEWRRRARESAGAGDVGAGAARVDAARTAAMAARATRMGGWERGWVRKAPPRGQGVSAAVPALAIALQTSRLPAALRPAHAGDPSHICERAPTDARSPRRSPAGGCRRRARAWPTTGARARTKRPSSVRVGGERGKGRGRVAAVWSRAPSRPRHLPFSSLPGLDDNGYDKAKCEAAFDAYKECKTKEVTRGRRKEEGDAAHTPRLTPPHPPHSLVRRPAAGAHRCSPQQAVAAGRPAPRRAPRARSSQRGRAAARRVTAAPPRPLASPLRRPEPTPRPSSASCGPTGATRSCRAAWPTPRRRPRGSTCCP